MYFLVKIGTKFSSIQYESITEVKKVDIPKIAINPFLTTFVGKRKKPVGQEPLWRSH